MRGIVFDTRQGAPVVVKTVGPRSDERLAWAALRHFAGRGSVTLLDHDETGRTIVIERVLPGDALVDLVRAGRDDEATAILCDVAALLHDPAHHQPLEADFPTVTDWGRGFDHYRSAGAAVLPAALVERASSLHAELAASQDAPRLLHGDLQHFNVLRDARRGWLAIDPKGVIGEPAYEPGAMLRDPWGDARFATPAVVERRTRIVAERLGLDRQRVLGWGFAQAVLSAIWSWEDGEDPAWGIAVAEAVLAVR